MKICPDKGNLKNVPFADLHYKKKKMLKKALRLKGNNARVKFNSLETNEEHGTW